MKNRIWKRVGALVLALVMSVSVLPAKPVLAEETAGEEQLQPEYYGLTKLGKPVAVKVTDEEMEKILEVLPVSEKSAGFMAVSKKDQFYKDLQKNMMKRSTGFSVIYNGKYGELPDDLDTILEKVRAIDSKSTSDDSDFLTGSMLYISYSVSYTDSKCVYKFAVSYTENASQVKKLNTKIQTTLKKMKINNYSDTAKVKLIHDYVVNLVSYDQTLADHSAYGGMVASKHTTVCQGYALLMYKMLTDAGVKAHYVTGYAGEGHAWNVVMIDKKWYYLDATWDDPVSSTPVLTYDYFLVGSKTLNKDHKTDSLYTKLYKVQASDLNWESKIKKSSKKDDKKVKTTQTKDEQAVSKLAKEKTDFVRDLNKDLDQELGYAQMDDLSKNMYDLYKDCIGSVIRQISDSKFNQMINGKEEIVEYIIGQVDEQITAYIINPMMEYMDTDEFAEAFAVILFEEFTEDEIEEMTDEQVEALAEAYTYAVFNEALSQLSKEYTEDIIDTIVEDVNNRSF